MKFSAGQTAEESRVGAMSPVDEEGNRGYDPNNEPNVNVHQYDGQEGDHPDSGVQGGQLEDRKEILELDKHSFESHDDDRGQDGQRKGLEERADPEEDVDDQEARDEAGQLSLTAHGLLEHTAGQRGGDGHAGEEGAENVGRSLGQELLVALDPIASLPGEDLGHGEAHSVGHNGHDERVQHNLRKELVRRDFRDWESCWNVLEDLHAVVPVKVAEIGGRRAHNEDEKLSGSDEFDLFAVPRLEPIVVND